MQRSDPLPVWANVFVLASSVVVHSAINVLIKASEGPGRKYPFSVPFVTLLAEAVKLVACLALLLLRWARTTAANAADGKAAAAQPGSPVAAPTDGAEYADDKDQEARSSLMPGSPAALDGTAPRDHAGSSAVAAIASPPQRPAHISKPQPATAPLSYIAKFALPALLYAFNNNLTYAILTMLNSPVTMQVFGCLEIVVIAIFSRMLLRRRLSGVQWASVALLCNGVVSSQLASCTHCESWADYPLDAACLTLLGASVSALAGVLVEKLMKERASLSLVDQNIYLYSFGLLSNAVGLVLKDRGTLVQDLTFQRFNWQAAALVLLWAYLGLITSAILKHMNNVVKAFATNSSLLLTTLLSALLFGFPITLPFQLAMVQILISVYLYRTASAPAPLPAPAARQPSRQAVWPRAEAPPGDAVAVAAGDAEDHVELMPLNPGSAGTASHAPYAAPQ